MALVEEAFVPELAHQPPDRLDVVVGEGPVGVLGVDPHRGALGERGEVLDVALHRLATPVVEVGDAVGLDVVLVGEAELLLDLELDREAVAVPAALAGNVVAAHGLEPGVEVFEHAGPDVVEAGAAVGRGRALVEDPRWRALAQDLHLLEEVDLAPTREHLLLERDEVDLRVHRTERHGPTVPRPWSTTCSRFVPRRVRATDATGRRRAVTCTCSPARDGPRWWDGTATRSRCGWRHRRRGDGRTRRVPRCWRDVRREAGAGRARGRRVEPGEAVPHQRRSSSTGSGAGSSRWSTTGRPAPAPKSARASADPAISDRRFGSRRMARGRMVGCAAFCPRGVVSRCREPAKP